MSNNPAYTTLLHSHTIPTGDLTFRNRLVLLSLPILSAAPEEIISPEQLRSLQRQSRGVGMTISPPCAVTIEGRAGDREWDCADDEAIPDLRRVAEAIHEGGALAVLHIRHSGRLSPSSIRKHAPMAPDTIGDESPVAELPHEMTEQEIEETIKAFGRGARRAILAGFDAVEIDGADGTLLQQFFSPSSNQRRDQWGGGVENRAAFPIAVLEEVREVVRRNAYRPFAIGYRLSPEEALELGISMDQTLQLVEGLVACRPDWIHVSTENFLAGSLRSGRDRRSCAAVIAERIAHRTDVLASGEITTAEQAASALAAGANLVGIGRSLVSSADWVEELFPPHPTTTPSVTEVDP